mmetsp:Transcript_66772/g.159725  ORF Transcript_66772/g.159725 Transcript_66772/m.159725 type:complete len:291 (+) Transcript_66772:416-1288(+)
MELTCGAPHGGMAPGGRAHGGIICGGIPIKKGGGACGHPIGGWLAFSAILPARLSSLDLLDPRDDEARRLRPRCRRFWCLERFACEPMVYRLQCELLLLPLLLSPLRDRLSLLLRRLRFPRCDFVFFFAGVPSASGAPDALRLPCTSAGAPERSFKASSTSASPSSFCRSTIKARPHGFVKFSALAARAASSADDSVTYENPCVAPVSGSLGMSTSKTAPCLLKSSRSSLSDVVLSKFLTKTLEPGGGGVLATADAPSAPPREPSAPPREPRVPDPGRTPGVAGPGRAPD